ncbi:MAG: cell wall hydrolase, partial [Lachnospiraceae bacterium]|nr:cell wall hydrolase [Lachnospiraceae bacterium]
SSYSTSSDGREKKASESDFYSSDGTNPLEGDEKLSESTFNPSSGVEFVEGDEKPADPEFSFSEDDRGDEKPSEEEFDRDYAPLDEEEGEVSFEDAAAAESDPKYDIRRYPEYRKAQAVLDKVDSLSKKIEKANDSLASLALEIEEKDAEIRRTEEEIDLMEKSLELVRREAQTIRHFLDTFIQYLYESRTDLGLAASLLRSGSFADFLNREHFVSLISRAFWDRLEEYERLEALIEMRTRELEELAQQQNRKKQELDASQERFREQIGRLSAQLARAEKKADSAQSAAQRLAEYLSSLEELENQVLEDTDPSLLGDSSDWSESIVSDGKEFWTSDKDYPYSESELVLMAGIIQAEAGNQPYEGKIAVGSVVMNRVESERFPNTIAGVIYSPNQFTPAGSGRLAVILAEGPTAECMQAARDVLGGRRNVNNLYFKSADYAASHGITGIKIADQVFH